MTTPPAPPTSLSPVDVEHFAQHFNRLLSNVELVLQGKRDQVAMALICVLAEGHLLIEDVPGTGKTVLAKSIANSIAGRWSRIQFTPDLLPSDVTGGLVYNQNDGTFALHRGPIFANIVLADEINRASPKTQSALLEVMEEQQVSIGGDTSLVPRPFAVIATQNPVEQAGTHRLPEAQLDRFLMRISLGYPDEEAEMAVLDSRRTLPRDIDPVLTTREVADMIQVARRVHVDPALRRYIVRLAAATRQREELRLGMSTRGALALQRASCALAASQGREYVVADDIKVAAPMVMAHRLIRTPDAELHQVDVADLVRDVLSAVELPTAASVA